MKDKIEKLNMAYIKMRIGLDLIKNIYPKDVEISLYIYRIQKSFGQLNKRVLQLLNKEVTDAQWKRIVDQLKKDGMK